MKEILVHLDHYPGSGERLAVAAGLARRLDARLAGLLVLRHDFPRPGAVGALEDLFKTVSEAEGLEAEWRCLDGSAMGIDRTPLVTHHAQYADLVVLGQDSPEAASVGVHEDLPEKVLLQSGRPVLVVPRSGSYPGTGTRVLVAWRPGAACTRALMEALPVLRKAQRVEVLARPGTDCPEGPEQVQASLSALLSRQGVAARVGAFPTPDHPVAEWLLNRVFDEGFDLLVTGALGRGEGARAALGGVASQLLREMTVPVFMCT
ncbi:MAG: universal stress protein [Acidobacteria bacterium]|nr:universal stress protein [Acidobacteriota bacterium]